MMSETMKSAFYRKYGTAAEVLEIGDLPVAAVEPGEVRVRVAFSGVNPSDCNRRRGIRDRLEDPLIIPHNDGSGVIEAVGQGVDPSRIGERVWIWNAQRGGRTFGTAAEIAVLPAENAVELPENVSLEEGACFGVPAITAYASLFADGPLDGLRVLVTGGAGAVGHYAVQFARLGGAELVATTVSSAEKAEHARSAGPDAVINYRSEDVAKRIEELTGGAGVDRISEVDFLGNLDVSAEAVARYGTICAYGSRPAEPRAFPFLPFVLKNVNLRFFQCSIIQRALREEATRAVSGWAAEGMLKHAIGKVFDLEDIAEAHQAVEDGRFVGNVVIRI